MQSLSERIARANDLLAPYAVPHGTGLGREYKEEEDATRFPFQRDRDRIIHTQAFRRLKGKTQVFVAGKGDLSDVAMAKSDHYRTRLTHTMEVTQISRGMARTLRLNEDLAECIALAHDLGHTPFGHAGEEAMNEEMKRNRLSFEHNLQSLRIVTLLEERTKKYQGLNLNQEVLEGLMKHRTIYDQAHGEALPRSPSLEAQIVNLADEIAYTAHDIDDGMRSEVLPLSDLVNIKLFAEAFAKAAEHETEVRGSMIHILVSDVYQETEERLQSMNIQSLQDVYNAESDIVSFSSAMTKKLKELRTFLFERFYHSTTVLRYSKKGKQIVHDLFAAYEANPPQKVQELQQKTEGTLPEAIKDYIAGMTDPYAEEKVQEVESTTREPLLSP